MHHTSITAMMTTTIITITIALVLLSSSSSIAITAADIKADRIANAKVFLESTRDIQMEDMRQYVAIPSVAAESKHDPDSRDAAEWLREWLIGRLGMKDAAIYESGYRNPVVIASTGDTSKPGIVIYGTVRIDVAYTCVRVSMPDAKTTPVSRKGPSCVSTLIISNCKCSRVGKTNSIRYGMDHSK